MISSGAFISISPYSVTEHKAYFLLSPPSAEFQPGVEGYYSAKKLGSNSMLIKSDQSV